MRINLVSVQHGQTINNHTYAHEMNGAEVSVLSLRDLDEKFTPVKADGFGAWHHAYALNGKACWFCESCK